LVLVVVFPLLACQTPPPGPVYTGIPQTGVSLVIPDDFRMAKQFPGLVGQDRVTTLMVHEVMGRIEDVRAGLTPAALAQRGMRTLRSEEASVDGRPALIVHAIEQSGPGATIRRWFVAFGAADAAVMLAASTSVQRSTAIGPVLLAMMTGARWDPAFALGRYDDLGFTVTESESLKISERLPQMLAFTRGGHRGTLQPAEPVFLAGASTSTVAVTDLAVFARQQLAGMSELVDPRILDESELRLDDLPGFEIVAEATDRASGSPLAVYQAVAVLGDRYYLLQGFVGAAGADEFMPQFRAIATSFRRTAAGP
jgi:hypothetical protein